MLARTVQNVYWLARYLERAENTARIINVSTNLLLDLPRGVTLGWQPLIAITGSELEFAKRGRPAEELEVVRFLIADADNPGSILSSLRAARENARTLREVIPTETWEQLNQFYHELVDEIGSGLIQRNRFNLLKRIVANSQALTGGFEDTMSRNDAYTFLQLGRNLERADMTSRIVDVRSEELKSVVVVDDDPYEAIQWMSVLKSLSGYQMYRLSRRTRVSRADVLDFLMRDREFPRSCVFCLHAMTRVVAGLPRAANVLAALDDVARFIESADLAGLEQQALQGLIDDLQVRLNDVHRGLAATYFPVPTQL